MSISQEQRGRLSTLATEFEDAVRQRSGVTVSDGTHETTLWGAIESLKGQYPRSVISRAHRVRKLRNIISHPTELAAYSKAELETWEEDFQSMIELFSGERVQLQKAPSLHVHVSSQAVWFLTLGIIGIGIVCTTIVYLSSIPRAQLEEVLTVIVVSVGAVFWVKVTLEERRQQRRKAAAAAERRATMRRKKPWWK